MDHVLQHMIANNIPLTRRNYLNLAFWDPDYEPQGEEEAMLPEMFRIGVQTSEHIN